MVTHDIVLLVTFIYLYLKYINSLLTLLLFLFMYLFFILLNHQVHIAYTPCGVTTHWNCIYPLEWPHTNNVYIDHCKNKLSTLTTAVTTTTL